MIIRAARKQDAPRVGSLLAECYNIASPKQGSNVFLGEVKRGFCYLVAEESKRIIGLASWVMHGLPKHGLAELDRIAVTATSRGKGVADALMEQLIRDTKAAYTAQKASLRKLYILTHAENTRAQAFYAKMGFAHEATLKSHYYAQKDEWVMSRFFDIKY